MQEYDLGIIGGGPAGYTAALHARNNGLSVMIFEKESVGGTCLNKGCIPTKAIIHSAEVFNEIQNSSKLGIFTENVSVDFSKVIDRKNDIVQKLKKSLELTLKNAGVKTIQGTAKLLEDNKITCENEIYSCKKIIVATGSKPREIKGFEFDHKLILSSDDILNLQNLPKSIAIIGSGAIGIEWARIFANFGVEVSVIEMAEHLVPLADFEVSKRVERIFKSKKIKMYLNNYVDTLNKHQNSVTLNLKNGESFDCEIVLVAIGRVKNEIEIPQNTSNITLLGDVSGAIQLAHVASKQAIEEVEGIKFDKTLVPSVIYGTPEIAWIGKREQDLEEGTYNKANILISALGKAHCDDCTEGFIKILSQNNEIIGASIVSKEASGLIQQIAIAMQNKTSIDKLKEVCFAHPTYSEGIFDCLFKL